ncbi:hypothetical protein E2C01_055901 [Portunus trituberculatus]|uniref:Uncharacterized protein n=1 Tax=Portunus trituberculatus TaxID=210409 RepID=A0A5B7GYW7_PORTR|nr:hypothetical protein [Portunus trituberculatus]
MSLVHQKSVTSNLQPDVVQIITTVQGSALRASIHHPRVISASPLSIPIKARGATNHAITDTIHPFQRKTPPPHSITYTCYSDDATRAAGPDGSHEDYISGTASDD